LPPAGDRGRPDLVVTALPARVNKQSAAPRGLVGSQTSENAKNFWQCAKTCADLLFVPLAAFGRGVEEFGYRPMP
jgi:hypothetical protein